MKPDPTPTPERVDAEARIADAIERECFNWMAAHHRANELGERGPSWILPGVTPGTARAMAVRLVRREEEIRALARERDEALALAEERRIALIEEEERATTWRSRCMDDARSAKGYKAQRDEALEVLGWAITDAATHDPALRWVSRARTLLTRHGKEAAR